ncbi:DUF4185 domain-containing protein [Mycolicibacterium sp.]|uniref:DUF4185 domain-containing protein n=1 Tax=Mycolicibacterium sp. TaxID=2320850 RepID=UPI0028AA4AB4|nr:DUF4185 domain-containing protein [Mycolicibacterium sp.]
MNSGQRSSGGAGAHIGRLGALAVALGIGAAMATGTGVAWADTSDTDTGSTSQASTGQESASEGPARRTSRGPSAARRGQPSVADAEPAAADSLPASIDTASRRAPITDIADPPAVAVRNDAPPSSPEPVAVAPAPVNPPQPQVLSRKAPVFDVPSGTGAAAAAAVPAPVATVATLPAVATSVLTSVPAPAAPVTLPALIATVPSIPVTAPAVAVQTLANRLLSAVGLAPLAGSTTPGVPLDSPALWALLGWTRRDPGRAGVRTAAAFSAQPSATTTALVTTPSTLPSTPLGWVTGQRNTAFPGLTWPQTNNTQWANIYGTDLGIMWFNGINGKTQLAFGDTFSAPNMTGDWRSNVLLLSDDTNLSDGLTLIRTGPAYQFIPAARNQVFIIGSEVTNIPTSGIYANNNNYVNYMSVKSWDTPGRWTTNYSAISQYNPATDKWELQTNTIRPAAFFRTWAPYQAGDQNFQQMAYVLQPESKVVAGEPRYVYAFGTPAGRAGSAYLSRVPEDSVTVMRKYEYWNGERWVGSAARAEAVIGDSDKSPGLFGWAIDIANNPNFFGGIMAGFTGAKTGGNVSEMSVQYNEYLDKYVVLYGNGANNVILRTADSPEGPWSDPITIATSGQYPGLYAPMIHPLSGTGQLTDSSGDPDDSNLYWNMSIWSNYNVVLMQTGLAPLAVTPV